MAIEARTRDYGCSELSVMAPANWRGVVDRFNETDHLRGAVHKIRLSFRGATVRWRPGIHNHFSGVMDSGLSACRRARNDGEGLPQHASSD